jgi:hypothetical protein
MVEEGGVLHGRGYKDLKSQAKNAGDGDMGSDKRKEQETLITDRKKFHVRRI